METSFFLLLGIGFLAGLMDAAVGGGGLLQIPALFNAFPHAAPASILGVNKFASACGTVTAGIQFVRKIRVPWKMLLPAAALAFICSYAGARLTSYIPVQYMKPAMLIIMAAMFIYTFLKKDLGQNIRLRKLTGRECLLGILFGGLIGFYDGVFGPGTGSLLTFVFVRFFALDFITATASSKMINITTNLAALSFFIPHNHIVWAWALPLAAANLTGGLIGARLAMYGGVRFLRYGFMILLLILIGKFGWDVFLELN